MSVLLKFITLITLIVTIPIGFVMSIIFGGLALGFQTGTAFLKGEKNAAKPQQAANDSAQ